MLAQDHELIATNRTVYHIGEDTTTEDYLCRLNISAETKKQILTDFSCEETVRPNLLKQYLFSGKLPLFSKRHAYDLPNQLENQWQFRNRQSQIMPNYFHLKILQLKISKNGTTTGLSQQKFKPSQEDFLSQQANAEKGSNRYFVRHAVTSARKILLLHDFFQHPLLLLDFANGLEGSVLIPFIPDLICNSKSTLKKPIVYVLSQIVNIIKIEGFETVDIIAHGTGVVLAIYLLRLLQVNKCIFSSPLINISEKELEINEEVQVLTQSKLPLNQQQVSASFESVEQLAEQLAEEEVDNIKMLELSHESLEPSEIEITPMSRKFSLVPKQNFHNSSSFVSPVIDDSDQLERARPRSQRQSALRTSVEHIISVDRHRSGSQLLNMDRLSIRIQESSQEDLIDLANLTMAEIYLSNRVDPSLLRLHCIDKLNQLKIVTELEDFLRVKKPHFGKIFPLLMQHLYSTLILTPLTDVRYYHINQKIFDQRFIEAMHFIIEHTLAIELLLSDKISTILVGSHDIIIPHQNYELIKSLSDKHHINYRSLVSCGHNLWFSGVVEIYNQLLK